MFELGTRSHCSSVWLGLSKTFLGYTDEMSKPSMWSVAFEISLNKWKQGLKSSNIMKYY